MATTTNYGWTTPDDTALVKDGAAAIRTLGSSVDTTTKALNPSTTLGDIEYRSATANTNTRLPIGTNGQVLSISGGVPAWATTADQTPLTTKGDIFTFTTVDARLGVGANGTVLTADSAEATGLKWATATASGLTFISKTAFTTSTTININSVFSSTYDNYRIIVFWNTPGGTVGDLTFKLRASGSDTSANYNQQRFYANQASTGASRNPFGTDEWFVGQGATSGIGTMSMDLFRPNLAATTGYTSQSGNFASNDTGMELTTGTQTDTTQFDGFSLLYSQSNTGTAYIYGYQKA
jgi:hypothetical protein